MNFLELLQNLGIYTLMIAGLSFLARSIVLQYFSKDLEKFKSTLAMAAYEHQIRFSRLHEKRAEIIGQTYADIVDLHNKASIFVGAYREADDTQKQENLKALWSAVSQFRTHFQKHRIYFDKDLSEKIALLENKLAEACNVLAAFALKRILTTNQEIVWTEWGKAVEIMKKDVPPIGTALEDKFREILGVIEPKRNKS